MKKRLAAALASLVLFFMLSVYCGYLIHMALSGQPGSLHPLAVLEGLGDTKVLLLSFLLFGCAVLFVLYALFSRSHVDYKSEMMKLTPNIKTPKPAGQGQYGTARWLEKSKYNKAFACLQLSGGQIPSVTKGGVLLGMTKDKHRVYFNSEDTHTLVIGATRSGKSRGVVLPSICLMAAAGESMVIVDPKGELAAYTHAYLRSIGYEVVILDFRYPLKSDSYNFLQPVIDAVNAGNTSLAVQGARDIAAMLAPETNAERIWTDGERSTLTMAILAVVFDNRDHPEYQNLANAREFISNMCRPVGPKGILPIEKYLLDKPESHPARVALGIAQVAPSRMRGSFYTSAIVAIDLFADPAIHSMTAVTDFDLYATGTAKRAIFICLPDHKEAYYPLAALFVYQHYQSLVDVTERYGGRLPRRVNFLCDEFGNFVKIPDFDKLITVGGGRGIRFHLFVQDVNQIDAKYGDKLGKTIRSNAETWIYLQTDDDDTLAELSRKLDKYTIKSPSLSGSTGGNMSSSFNLTGRDLLTPGEIKSIRRPYQLVTSRYDPAMMYAPDIAQTPFQPLLGMGGMKHNQRMVLQFNAQRQERKPDACYWRIWNLYIRAILAAAKPQE